MSNIVSTNHIQENDRLDFWYEAVRNYFVEMECDHFTENTDFHGYIETHAINEWKFSTVSSSAQHVKRTNHLISKSDSDVFLLSLQLKGEGTLSQHGRKSNLVAGDMVLYDTSKTYDFKFDNEFSQLVVQIPRKVIKKFLTVPDKLVTIKLSHTSPCSLITRQMMKSIYNEGGNVLKEQKNPLLRSFMEILNINFQDNYRDYTFDISTTQYMKIVMIQNYILSNISDCDLSPQIIAQEFRISTRYLYRVFSKCDVSLSRWINNKRLEHCEADLRNSLLRGLTVSEICFKWGFNDTSHFSRIFKKQYFFPPSEYRKKYLYK